jgi:hypothetical protein
VYLNTWCLCQKGQYKFHHGFKSFKSPQQNAMDGLWCLVPLSTIENDIDKCVVDCTNTFGNERIMSTRESERFVY